MKVITQKQKVKCNYRSNCAEVFCKKSALKSFAKFTGKPQCHSLFLNKVAGLGLQLY